VAPKKRLEVRELADMLAAYGPVVLTEPLTYEQWVGLWLNLPRQSARQTWSAYEALRMALTNDPISPEAVEAVADSPEEAEELAYAINSERFIHKTLGQAR
jgi:hypothetical protein